MDGSSYRVEAERWLTIAEKLLTARDFQGAKTFAIRARESDPRLVDFSDQIIAVADTLIAGDLRIVSYNGGGGGHDYYAILQVPRLTQSMDIVAAQYRKLALMLNPTRNRLSYADHAFRLVSEAWMVFSNPTKKAMYDHELQMSQLGQLGQLGQLAQLGMPGQEFPQGQTSQGNVRRSPRVTREEDNMAQPDPIRSPRYETQPRMTEPIRPIAQHKVSEPPIRPVPQSIAQHKPSEPIRPSPQPVASEPSRPATQPKAAEFTRPAASKAQEQTRPAAQSKVPESTRPATEPASVEPAISTRSVIQSNAAEKQVPSFWTACPYCFILYEFPKGYEDCAIRCPKCKRAFHAAMIPPPPVTGKDTYFCSWGFFPLGFSGGGKGGGGFGTNWSPVSAMFAAPLPGGEKSIQSNQSRRSEPKVIYKDDVYIDLSEPSDESDSDDDDWDNTRKKVKNAKGKATPVKNVKKSQTDRTKKVNVQNVEGGSHARGEVVGKGEGSSAKKKGAKDLGKLDLNVMFSNEVEEAVPGVSEGNGTGHGEEDNIEGIGFFEGLDEFLSSLPILSVVGDDKVKAS